MVRFASAIEKCVVRFGSSRHAGVSRGCDDHRDIAPDVGPLVEGAAGELFDVAAEVLAQDAADHATEAAGRRASQAARSHEACR